MFGAHHYTHFFYAGRRDRDRMDIVMVGSEFCLGKRRLRTSRLDCEVIQYVTGLVQVGDALWITYGSNDCSPLRATLPLQFVLDDLVNTTYIDTQVTPAEKVSPPIRFNMAISQPPRHVARREPKASVAIRGRHKKATNVSATTWRFTPRVTFRSRTQPMRTHRGHRRL